MMMTSMLQGTRANSQEFPHKIIYYLNHIWIFALHFLTIKMLKHKNKLNSFQFSTHHGVRSAISFKKLGPTSLQSKMSNRGRNARIVISSHTNQAHSMFQRRQRGKCNPWKEWKLINSRNQFPSQNAPTNNVRFIHPMGLVFSSCL